MIQICLLSFISDFGIRISNFFNEEGLLDLMSMSRARVRHIFSAKGAAFTSSLGAAPQDSWNPKPPALKARFTSPSSWIIIRSMPQSLSKVILHIIFSTKNREPWLDYDMQPRMHAYLATICRDLGTEFVRVGGVADHVHIVTTLPRTLSQAELIEQIKKISSKWIKTIDTRYRGFLWQRGYGAFSVSPSQLMPCCNM